jgi:hypothetical protein
LILVKQWHGIPDLYFIVMYHSARSLFSNFVGLGLVKLISQLSATRASLGSTKHAVLQGLFLGCVNISSSFAQGLGLVLLYAPSGSWYENLEYVLIARIGMSVLGLTTVLFVPSFVYEDHDIRAGPSVIEHDEDLVGKEEMGLYSNEISKE